MGRGSPIPPMLRRKIVEQYQKGVSQRKIAKSLKLSSSTVHNIIQRFRESGTISVRKGALYVHCITYRNATVMEITTWAQEYFQKTLSVNTIHRAICRCRLKLYRSKKKPYLNMIQKRRRFLWAKAHLKWTVAKWKTVLWSDESKFEVLFGKLGRHVIRTKEDKDNPSCYQRSVQKPASLMVWGCMSVCGMGSLHIWKGTINAESITFPSASPDPFMSVTCAQCKPALIHEENWVPIVDLPVLVFSGKCHLSCMVLGREHRRPGFNSQPIPKPQPLDAVLVPRPEKWEGCVRKGIRHKICAKLLCRPVAEGLLSSSSLSRHVTLTGVICGDGTAGLACGLQ
ncbi:hypothetical protein QTP86_007736 [Hemibagrus guttatus]|nr:hypothetical protein QTP86_007736 [Hemibagrus guttatus]